MRRPRLTRKRTLSADSRPVQTELSLDAVKVVRNDLNDTDVCVVPAPRAGAPASRPGRAGVLASATLAGKVLDRLADRIVGAGRT